MKINELPQEVQQDIKNTLKAFDEVNVIFEYGKYNVSTGIAIKKVYGADHKFIGTYHKNEVYTKDEQIENYVNEFFDYPIEYKGKKDYLALKEFEDLRRTGKKIKAKLINGDIEFK